MDEGQIEVINFSDLQVPIHRENSPETYLALQPPDALPYVVAPRDMPVETVAAFIQQNRQIIDELQADMRKHFKKTKSLKCRFRTGDVAYLLGRPFMLRSYPLSSVKKVKRGIRGRANVQATMHRDYSVIDLYVAQVGNFDQGKAAFLSYAQPVFARNVKSLLEQCMQRVFPQAVMPANVNCRPMRDSWVRFDEARDTVWFSEKLIPYPPDAVVYAYLVEAVKYYAPDADESQRLELLQAGVPNWQEMRALLQDPQNRFSIY